MKRILPLIFLICLGVFSQESTFAQTRIYVDASISSSGSGGGWASPVKTIYEALNTANVGSGAYDIWVKAGTYYPMQNATTVASSRDSSFRILRNGVSVYGGFVGTETALTQRNIAAHPSILSGDIGTVNDSTDNVYHVFTIVGTSTSQIDTNTILDGLTITRGENNAGGFFYVNGTSLSRTDGGGVLVAGNGSGNKCSPLISNCTLSQNAGSYYGGAGYFASYSGGESSPVLRNCIISNNMESNSAGFAIYGSFSMPVFTDCTFSGNKSFNGDGGAVFANSGAGLVIPAFDSCIFTGNTSTGVGGAVCLNGHSSSFSNCSFNGNSSNFGGAIYVSNDSLTSSNNIFTANTANGYGGAVAVVNASWLSASNCDFINDSTANFGGALAFYSSIAGTITGSRFINNYGSVLGAIDKNSSANLDIVSSVFSGNKCQNIGGVLHNNQGTTNFTNCVLTGNSTAGGTGAGGGAVHLNTGTTVNFYNTTLYGNSTASTGNPNSNSVGADGTSTVNFNNTILWDNGISVAGTGTVNYAFSSVNTDPQFVNAANPIGADNIWGTADDGLKLSILSSAVNAGSNALIPSGITTDITGAARIQQTTVDMGAYENLITCPGGTRLYVDSSKASSGTGTSWTTAYKTVWEALTAANRCSNINEIWVAKGTYFPMQNPTTISGSRDSSFRILRNGIKIYGGFAGTETALSQRNISANPSILSGDIGTVNDSTDNSDHVVTIISPSGTTIDTTTVIDGLTITRANANGGNFSLGTIITLVGGDGGGILSIANGTGTQCNPLIQNCTFTRNKANVGGSFYSRGASGISNPTFRYCTFLQNYASDVAGLHSYADGGGFSN
ncbi:MAG: choice-of-anchor Q domain-containing protein, partial [Chitinophagaceae bacterium]